MCVIDMAEDTCINQCDVTYRSLTSVADQLISLSNSTDVIPRLYCPQEKSPSEDQNNGEWQWSITSGTEVLSPCSQEVTEISTVGRDIGPHRLDQFIMSFLKESPQKQNLQLIDLSSSFAKWNQTDLSQGQQRCEARKGDTVRFIHNEALEESSTCKCEICNIQFVSPKVYRTHMSSCHLRKCQFMNKRLKKSHSKPTHDKSSGHDRLRNGTRNVTRETITTESQLKKDSTSVAMLTTCTNSIHHKPRENLSTRKTVQYYSGKESAIKSNPPPPVSNTYSIECERDDLLPIDSTDQPKQNHGIALNCGMNDSVSMGFPSEIRDFTHCISGSSYNGTDETFNEIYETCCARTLPYDYHIQLLQTLHRDVISEENNDLRGTAKSVLGLPSNFQGEITSPVDRQYEDYPAKYRSCARTKPVSQHLLEIYSEKGKAVKVMSKLQYWLEKGRQLMDEDFSVESVHMPRETAASAAGVITTKTKTNSHNNSMLCSAESQEKEVTRESVVCADCAPCKGNGNSCDACSGSDVSSCTFQENEPENCCEAYSEYVFSSHTADLPEIQNSEINIASTNISVKPLSETDSNHYAENAVFTSDSERVVSDLAKYSKFQTPDDLCGVSSVEITDKRNNESSLPIVERLSYPVGTCANDKHRLLPELSDNGWILLDGNVSDYIRSGEENDDDDDDDGRDVYRETEGKRMEPLASYPDDTLCKLVNVTEGSCARTRLYFNMGSSSLYANPLC